MLYALSLNAMICIHVSCILQMIYCLLCSLYVLCNFILLIVDSALKKSLSICTALNNVLYISRRYVENIIDGSCQNRLINAYSSRRSITTGYYLQTCTLQKITITICPPRWYRVMKFRLLAHVGNVIYGINHNNDVFYCWVQHQIISPYVVKKSLNALPCLHAIYYGFHYSILGDNIKSYLHTSWKKSLNALPCSHAIYYGFRFSAKRRYVWDGFPTKCVSATKSFIRILWLIFYLTEIYGLHAQIQTVFIFVQQYVYDQAYPSQHETIAQYWFRVGTWYP